MTDYSIVWFCTGVATGGFLTYLYCFAHVPQILKHWLKANQENEHAWKDYKDNIGEQKKQILELMSK